MLQTIYVLDRRVPLNKALLVEESRGCVRFAIHPRANRDHVIRRMNEEVDRLCRVRGWLQLWDGGVKIVSVTFEVRRLDTGPGVESQETDGHLLMLIDDRLTVSGFVAAMNPTAEKVIAGGQLFQCWEGEIVSNASLARGDGEPAQV